MNPVVATILSAALSVAIDNHANITISRGAQVVASGPVAVADVTRLLAAPDAPFPTQFTLVSVAPVSGAMTFHAAAGTVIVTPRFLDPEDIEFDEQAAARAPVGDLMLTLPTVKFTKNAAGLMPSWFWTYFQGSKGQLLSCTPHVPFPAAYVTDGVNGLGLATSSHLSKPCCFNATQQNGVPDGYVPADCQPQCIFELNLGANQSGVFDARMRLSQAINPANLLADYISLWKAQNGAAAMANSDDPSPCVACWPTDPTSVKPSSPLGFGESCRLDTAAGVASFDATIGSASAQAGCKTIFLWDGTGAYPGAPHYNPTPDRAPPRVLASLAELSSKLSARGVKMGLSIRPCDATTYDVTFLPGTTGALVPMFTTERVAPWQPAMMSEVLGRFTTLSQLNLGAYYMDSAPLDDIDNVTIANIRAHMGREVRFYPEYANSKSVAYASGVYYNTTAGQTKLTPRDQVLRLLNPNFIFLTADVGGIGFDAMGSMKMTPLIDYRRLRSQIRSLQAFRSKYLANGQWK
jgi:hypothetical protein